MIVSPEKLAHNYPIVRKKRRFRIRLWLIKQRRRPRRRFTRERLPEFRLLRVVSILHADKGVHTPASVEAADHHW